MRVRLSRAVSRLKYFYKKIIRFTKKELNSTYTIYLIALWLGLTLSLSPLLLPISAVFYIFLSKKPKKILYTSTLLIFSSFIYTSLFMYNLANLDTSANLHEVVIISKYQDYYEGYSFNTNSIVQIYSSADLSIFSKVLIKGMLRVNKTNPYYSISRNTPFNISPDKLYVISNGLPLITNIKEKIITNLDYNLSKGASDFAKSLIFGDSSYIDKEIKEDFKQIGILHVIALSGYNFILILNLVNSCLFFIDKRKRGLITIPIGILYLLIAGVTNLSGLRALVFFILATLTSYFGIYISRTKLILTSIVFFLVLNPLNIFSFSLMLSYSAYFGIVIASKIKGNKIKKLILEQVTVSLFTLPTLALISSTFNVLSLVINILLSPVVSLISVILVIAQVMTPILSFTDILIKQVLIITSKLSDISLPVNGFIFLALLILIMYITYKITNLTRL
jgi:competence protein ComEC